MEKISSYFIDFLLLCGGAAVVFGLYLIDPRLSLVGTGALMFLLGLFGVMDFEEIEGE